MHIITHYYEIITLSRDWNAQLRGEHAKLRRQHSITWFLHTIPQLLHYYAINTKLRDLYALLHYYYTITKLTPSITWFLSTTMWLLLIIRLLLRYYHTVQSNIYNYYITRNYHGSFLKGL